MTNLQLILFVFLLVLRLGKVVGEDEDDLDYLNIIQENRDLQVPERILRKDEIRKNNRLAFSVFYDDFCKTHGGSWKCMAGCREIHAKTDKGFPQNCTNPEPQLTCFGMPITYRYVKEDLVFPAQYEVFSHFPKCWSYLAPFICTRLYRPCSINQVHEIVDNKEQNQLMQSLYRMRANKCNDLLMICQDVISIGAFPKWLNCSRTRDTLTPMTNESYEFPEKFLSSSCNLRDTPLVINHVGKCPFPLVEREYPPNGSRPVIDRCYLACRSPQLPEYVRSRFYYFQLFFGFIVTVGLFSTSIYFSCFSYVYEVTNVMFAVSHALGTASIYFGFWTLGTVPVLAKQAECTDDGLRRYSNRESSTPWCSVQTFILTFSFVAAYLWLLAHFVLSYVQPAKYQVEKSSRHQPRSVMCVCIYISAATIGLATSVIGLGDTDGVSGVCMAGLTSSFYLITVLLLPLTLIYVPTIFYGFWYHFKKDEKTREAAEQEMIAKVTHLETEYRKRVYTYGIRKLNYHPNTSVESMKKVDWEEIIKFENENKTDITLPAELEMTTDHISPRDLRPHGYFHRKVAKILIRIDDLLAQNNFCAPKEEFQKYAAHYYADSYMRLHRERRETWKNSFWNTWSSFSVMIVVISFIAIAILHVMFVSSMAYTYEAESIMQHLKCGLNESLSEKAYDWNPDEYARSVTPPFENCKLQYLDHPYRIDVLMLIKFLEALPFLVILWAFAAGCNSMGGMLKARWVRNSWSVWCCSTDPVKEEEVELQLLTRTTDLENGTVPEIREPESDDDIQFPEGDRTRFSSTGNLTRPRGSHSPSPSSVASEPGNRRERRQSFSSGVRKLDLIGRAREHKLKKEAQLKHDKNRRTNNVASLSNTGTTTSGDVGSSSSLSPSNDSLFGFNSSNPDMNVVVRMVQTSAQRDGIFLERQRVLLGTMKEISAYLNYSKLMLNNDSVAWSLAMTVMTRMEALLRQLFAEEVNVDDVEANSEFYQSLNTLYTELSAILPILNTHSENLGPWTCSVQDSMTVLRCATANLAKSIDVKPKKFDPNVASTSSQCPTPGTPTPSFSYPTPPVLDVANLQPSGSMTNNNSQQVAVDVHPAPSPSNDQRIPPTINHQRVNEVSSTSTDQQNNNPKPFAGFGCIFGPPSQSSAPQTSKPDAVEGPTSSTTTSNQQVPEDINAELVRILKKIKVPKKTTVTQPKMVSTTHISAYTEAYCVLPYGFVTSLPPAALSQLTQRLRDVCHEQLWPQEIMYILLLAGNIRRPEEGSPREGEELIRVPQYRDIFGQSPSINATHSPDEWSAFMCRRALTLVGAIGFHYNSHRNRNAGEYRTPVLPPLGLEMMENELVLGRIIGAEGLLPVREFIRSFDGSNRDIRYRPELDLIRYFTTYFDYHAERLGFPVQRDEFIPDPAPSSIDNLEEPSDDQQQEEDGLISEDDTADAAVDAFLRETRRNERN